MIGKKEPVELRDPEVHRAALIMLHTRTPAILGANLVNGTVLALCFVGEIKPLLLWSWYAGLMLSVAGRSALWWQYRNLQTPNLQAWEFAAVAGSSISGLLWGLAGTLFFLPQSVGLATLTAFVLGGMAAGALAMLTAHLAAFRLFVLLSLLPFSLRLIWEGGDVHLAMAAMFVTYMVVILVAGPQMHAAIVESLALRFENSKLLRNLEERVNARTIRHATVVDFSQRALSGLALDEVLLEATTIVREGLSASGAVIMQLLSENVLIVRAISATSNAAQPKVSFPADPNFAATCAISRGEPLIVEDFAREPTLKVCPPLSECGVRSTLCVPIWVEGRAQAVLQAWSTEPQSIAPDDVHFVRSVATTIAAAVQRQQAENYAQRLALHDPLTTLPNRTLFREDFARSLSRGARTGRRVAMLLIDLDHFKDVNDALGHQTGDLLLVKAADRLRRAVRREESPARLGGDEFAIVLPDLESADQAVTVARHIVGAFAEPFDLDGQVVQIGASIGITMFPDDGHDPDDLLRNADLALYRAKARGRANYEFYSKDLSQIVETRVKLLRHLREAIDHEEFTLVYQPQISLSDGRLSCLEAFLRWRTESRGNVPPDEFIPIAEANGLMSSIDNWTIQRACGQARQWIGGEPSRLLITVNLSLAEWRRRDMLPTLERTLAACACDLRLLGLEITERAFPVSAEGELLEFIRRLHVLGISISIDDFGTGYLNLARLQQLPVDRIKIDHSFIAGVGHDVNAESIVRAIVMLGRNLGLEVVAEGVETKKQLDFLRAEGCEFAQGYYFARPMPAEAVPKRLAAGALETISFGAPNQPPDC
jgi:diguanylate cyclase (GGDEF)-like protein